MFQVDVLSGYLICGVDSLVAAAMLRMAEANDPRTQDALRVCGLAFVTLGVSLLPAGLGAAVAHPAAQFSLAFGSLAGLVLVARGLGQLQGRILATSWVLWLIAASAAATSGSMLAGPRAFGIVFAAGLVGTSMLIVWFARGFISSPRDATERALGASLIVLAVSTWVRLGFTLDYSGPAQVHMMYAPAEAMAVFAVLYGVLPMLVATLLLSLVNTRLRQQLRTRAITDELTGSMTRRALRELAPALIEQEQLRHREVAVLMLDMDRFKNINDTYGHHTGDGVLQIAASALRSAMRADTLLARYGGEEFVAIVPVDDLPAARRVAERLRRAVVDVNWRDKLKLADGVTASVGVAIIGPEETLDMALKRADEALYRAKRDGRNQCQFSLAVA